MPRQLMSPLPKGSDRQQPLLEVGVSLVSEQAVRLPEAAAVTATAFEMAEAQPTAAPEKAELAVALP